MKDKKQIPIRQQLQECLDEEYEEYKLKTDQEILDYIGENGNGFYDFHAADVERLAVECMRMKEILGITEI